MGVNGLASVWLVAFPDRPSSPLARRPTRRAGEEGDLPAESPWIGPCPPREDPAVHHHGLHGEARKGADQVPPPQPMSAGIPEEDHEESRKISGIHDAKLDLVAQFGPDGPVEGSHLLHDLPAASEDVVSILKEQISLESAAAAARTHLLLPLPKEQDGRPGSGVSSLVRLRVICRHPILRELGRNPAISPGASPNGPLRVPPRFLVPGRLPSVSGGSHPGPPTIHREFFHEEKSCGETLQG